MNHHLVQKGFQLGFFTLSFLLIILYVYHFTSSSQSQQMAIELPALHEHEASLGSLQTRSDKFNGSNIKHLPQTVIDRVKTFVFFVGHGRSGHSIVGSLMDSHPHMVISHELDLFRKLSYGLLAPTKSAIFNAIWENTQQTINASIELAMASSKSNSKRAGCRKGYTLLVDGLYQGRYVNYIDVIGDKKAGATAEYFSTKPDSWRSVFNILKSLSVTLRVIHVIRNPYDNIATMVLLSVRKVREQFQAVKESNKTYEITHRIGHKTKQYFLNHQAIVDAKKKYDLDVIEIHGKDLISNPRGTLIRLCNYLGVTCSDKYLEICSNKIYKSESRTRDKIEWTDSQIKTVQENIEKYDCLKGYSFDSL